MAILDPELRPSEDPEPDPEALNADGVGEEVVDVVGRDAVGVSTGTDEEYVEVTTMTDGGAEPSVLEGV